MSSRTWQEARPVADLSSCTVYRARCEKQFVSAGRNLIPGENLKLTPLGRQDIIDVWSCLVDSCSLYLCIDETRQMIIER